MSGFAVIFDRSNISVDPGMLDRIMKQLSHRGPDGQDIWCSNSVAMGHLHFWTTPEEVGELQPLRLPAFPYTIVMDGRLDNRSDIINRLNMNPEEASHLSDAALVLHSYSRWNTNIFSYLIGEFSIVIWDHLIRKLVCARDSVGDRTLFYSFQGTLMIIASEPWAIVAGVNRQVELDERAIAYHFARQIPEDGQTLFKNIYEMLPAHWMSVDTNSEFHQHYWQPSSIKKTHNRSDADYVEEFRDVLETSVRCRLRSVNPPAVMMSGGLDSTSVACIAAKILSPTPLTTVSYVFDEFLDCDERQYINAVSDQYGTRSIQIPCDDIWPFKNMVDWPLDPSCPPANPYRLLLERTYSKARDEGFTVMLTGMYGDNLYWGSTEWLADLIVDKHFGELNQELIFLITKYGLSNLYNSKVIQRTIKQLLLRIPGVKSFRRPPTSPKWLTPYSASFLADRSLKRDSEKQAAMLNLRDAAGNTREIFYTNRNGIEVRSPYHDRRLIEFVLGLPGYTLFSKGVTRRILRKAMDRILPVIVGSRPGKTNLLTFYNFGVQQQKLDLKKYYYNEDAIWRKYVKADVVLNEWHVKILPQTDGQIKVVPPLCLFYELWYKSLFTNEI